MRIEAIKIRRDNNYCHSVYSVTNSCREIGEVLWSNYAFNNVFGPPQTLFTN